MAGNTFLALIRGRLLFFAVRLLSLRINKFFDSVVFSCWSSTESMVHLKFGGIWRWWQSGYQTSWRKILSISDYYPCTQFTIYLRLNSCWCHLWMRCLSRPFGAFIPFSPDPILKISNHGASSRHINWGSGSQFKLWHNRLLSWDWMNRVSIIIPQIY